MQRILEGSVFLCHFTALIREIQKHFLSKSQFLQACKEVE